MNFHWHRYIFCSVVALTLFDAQLFSTDYVVDTGTDSSVSVGGYSSSSTSGDFRYVLNQILNTQALNYGAPANDYTITFTVPKVTFSQPPPAVNLFNGDNITIGNSSGTHTVIDGGGLYRPFFIVQGTVTLRNLNIQNGLAQGGNGGNGAYDNTQTVGGSPPGPGNACGGGGMGAGGAIFIDSAAVTLHNVNFYTNAVSAGLGGTAPSGGLAGDGGGAGGGGMGGNGGDAHGGMGAAGGGGIVGKGGSSTCSAATFGGGGGGGFGGDGGNGDNGSNGGGGGAIIGANGGDGNSAGVGAAGGTVTMASSTPYVFGGGGGTGTTTGGVGGGLSGGNPSATGLGGGGGYQGNVPYAGIGGGGGGGGGSGQASGGPGGGAGGGDSNTGGYGGGGGSGYSHGNGGFGGGASSSSSQYGGGEGGFGGGGGGGGAFWPGYGSSDGGSGGFGGGGGGGLNAGSNAGGGPGATNSTNTTGGDGAACGGAIFVGSQYLSSPPNGLPPLTITGNCSFNNSSVSANGGGGVSVGTDIFASSYYSYYPITIVFAPGTGNTVTLSGTIADDSSNSIQSGSTWNAGSGNSCSILMQGPGTVVLEGINSYIGGMDSQGNPILGSTVTGGRLSVNGQISGGITVQGGGTIGGTGIIYGGGSISGTLSPGNSIGTLTFDTSVNALDLVCKAVTNIEISPTAASKIIILGSNGINLGDTFFNVTADPGNYGLKGSYLVLEGVYNGTFYSTLTGGMPGYIFSLSYDPNAIYLLYQIIPISTGDLACHALQMAEYFNQNGPADALVLFNSLSRIALSDALNKASPGRNAFGNYISQQLAFSLSNIVSQHIDSFRIGDGTISYTSNTISMEDLLVAASEPVIAKKRSLKTNGYAGWLSGFGEASHQSGGLCDPSFDYYSTGLLLGFDYYINKNSLMGSSIGYAYTHFVEASQNGHGKINYYFGNIYGNLSSGSFYCSPAVWGIFHQIKNVRQISFTDFSGDATATIYGWQCIPHFEIGYEIKHPHYVIPFTQVDWAVTWQQGYREKGAEPFIVKSDSHSSSLLRSETGIKLYQKWDRSWGTFSLKEKLSYVYEKPFGSGAVVATFIGAPTPLSLTTVVNEAFSLADVGIEFGAVIGKEHPTVVNINFDGEVGPTFWSNQLTLKVEF